MESFISQWRRTSRVKVGAASIALHGAVPEGAARPPIILVPGWLEGSDLLRDDAQALFSRGWSVYVPETAGSARVAIDPALREVVLPKVELRKASILAALLREPRFARVHLVAHSEGALAALAVARLVTSQVETVLLVDPAGFTGLLSFWALCGSYLREMGLHAAALLREARGREPFHEDQFRRGFSDVLRGVCTLLRHPIESWRSARAVAKSDARPLLAALRGVPVRVLAGEEDRLFPFNRLDFGTAEVALTPVPKASHVWQLLEPGRFGDLVSRLVQFESTGIAIARNAGEAASL